MPRKYSGILNPVQPQDIENSYIFKTLTYSEPEAYAEPWHIQNRGIFRTRGKFRTLSNIYDGALCKNC